MKLPSCTILGALATTAIAHMQLTYPAPFNASNNPHLTTAPDPYLQFPYDCCGPSARWTFPCRGYQSLLGKPGGEPTTVWAAGSQQNWSIAGIGHHYGGSCQVGFSVDNGETFKVATSYEGNCPNRKSGKGPADQAFPFIVPADMKPGVHIFAWTWYNREQEFNMNCAAVNITGADATASQPTSSLQGYGSSSTTPIISTTSSRVPNRSLPVYKTANDCTCTCENPAVITSCTCVCPQTAPSTSRRPVQAFENRPEMFVADDGNGCLTPKTSAELKFPDPGFEVVTGDGEYELRLPSGKCGDVGQQAYGG